MEGGHRVLETKLEKENLFFWLCRIGEQFQTAFLVLDTVNHRILYANNIFTELTGYITDDVKNQTFESILQFGSTDWNSKREVLCRRKDGSALLIDVLRQPFFDDEGNHIFDVMIFHEKNHKIPNQLEYIDPISGLTDYEFFLNQLQKKIGKNTTGFVLLIQPTNYLQIIHFLKNAQLSLLQKEIEKRIRSELSDIEIIISKTSEASLIVFGICHEDKIEHYTKKLSEIKNQSFIINQMELFISFNIGVVSLSYFTGNIHELVHFADIALNVAKKSPGNTIVSYKEEYGIEIEKTMELQNELIRAIQNREIAVHLQPKVKIGTGEVEGFEALARWHSKLLGVVSPAVFIEVAESLGQIKELDSLIIEQVLQWLRKRKERNQRLYQVAVNISPSHFYTPTFVEDLIGLTNLYGIDPKYLKLEITESICLVDIERANSILQSLQKFGFENSVDDFGVGFSSLSYLMNLPISEIKIARNFVNKVHDDKGRIIVQSIIQMAKNMGLHTVAEGIETREQLQLIHKMECPTAQGFYFYKPMPIENVDQLIK